MRDKYCPRRLSLEYYALLRKLKRAQTWRRAHTTVLCFQDKVINKVQCFRYWLLSSYVLCFQGLLKPGWINGARLQGLLWIKVYEWKIGIVLESANQA